MIIRYKNPLTVSPPPERGEAMRGEYVNKGNNFFYSLGSEVRGEG